MEVLTILNHGTANSTNVNTSDGCVLVISQLARMLAGVENDTWRLNQGAGTSELRHTGVRSSSFMGVAKGAGVEQNVLNSVAWVKNRLAHYVDVQVNLAGHSRGSITCYKIARALCDDPTTRHIRVNIFAIDPVPGNTGRMNKENYKNIALGGNLDSSFLLLAESEHRLVFRPYVDAVYATGSENHEFDTIPGTHGGINMLGGLEREAAAIVLSRAFRFLSKRGSKFNLANNSYFMLDGKRRLEKYAEIMLRLPEYKSYASMWKPVNFAMSGFQVDRHRIVNVHGPKQSWGGNNAVLGAADATASSRTRGQHHGLRIEEAMGRMMQGDEAIATRPHRFFVNLDHQKLFQKHYAPLFQTVRSLEQKGLGSNQKDEIRKALNLATQSMNQMAPKEKEYFGRFCAKRGVM